MKPRPGLRRIRPDGTGRHRIQRIDELLAKARHPIAHQVATHDPVGEPRLINLVDDTAVALEILCAARDELIQRLFGFLAAAHRVAYADPRHGCTRIDRFHLPKTDAVVAAVLLQHTRLAFGEALRQLALKLCCASDRALPSCPSSESAGAPTHGFM